MKAIDRLISFWSVSLIVLLLILPALSDAFLMWFGLPYVLSNMLMAFFVGLLLGKIQNALLKPFVTIPYWVSNTTIASVVGALLVGAAGIFVQSMSELSPTFQVPIVYLLLMVGFTQARSLALKKHYKILYGLTYLLMSVFAVQEFWLGMMLVAIAHSLLLLPLVYGAEKRKKSVSHEVLARLSDSQDDDVSAQYYQANRLCSLQQNSLS